MPRIKARADNLDELNANFDQVRLAVPVFLNSVPKCGTHLMRNILRMFVPVDQQYNRIFIQHPVLRQHLEAFSPAQPRLSWGHLLFSDDAAMALREVRHTVLVRDPYDWVLARTRFFLSDNFQGSLEHLKSGQIAIDEIMNMMILGIHQKAPALQEIFLHNAVGWLGTKARLVKFEDIVRHLADLESDATSAYFADLLRACGIDDLPADWRERVRAGADRKQSGTARENLDGPRFDVPNILPDVQKRMVDVAAPGLRSLLGYD